MITGNLNIDRSWKQVLTTEFSSPYFQELISQLREKALSGVTIYPPETQIYSAFNATPFDKVKAVIIGQDPYHRPGQAMGLSFSVPKGIRIPPSLRNVYKEIAQDSGEPIPEHGDLTSWAEQGVFLLNAILTVEESRPGAHKKIGWQRFTDAVISNLSDKRDGIIFMLWGKYAQSKKVLINSAKHYILEAAHPSPLARNAFSGCKHFSKCNELLKKQGKSPINWSL